MGIQFDCCAADVRWRAGVQVGRMGLRFISLTLSGRWGGRG